MLSEEIQRAQVAIRSGVDAPIDPGFALMISCQTKTGRFEKTFVHGAICWTARARALEGQ